MEKEAKNYGRAYSFFDLKQSKNEIESELDKARKSDKAPSGLELTLRDMKEFANDKNTDPDLIKCINEEYVSPHVPTGYDGPISTIKQKKIVDLKYVLETKYLNATNDEAVAQTIGITNLLYKQFNKDKPFYVDIILKAPDGKYHNLTND